MVNSGNGVRRAVKRTNPAGHGSLYGKPASQESGTLAESPTTGELAHRECGLGRICLLPARSPYILARWVMPQRRTSGGDAS